LECHFTARSASWELSLDFTSDDDADLHFISHVVAKVPPFKCSVEDLTDRAQVFADLRQLSSTLFSVLHFCGARDYRVALASFNVFVQKRKEIFGVAEI